MEKNDLNVARWVDEKLASLQPATPFRPNVSTALARVQERSRAYQTSRRWFWGSAVAAAVVVGVMALPTQCAAASSSSCSQPVATRLWDSVFHQPAEPVTTAYAKPPVPPPPAPRPALPTSVAAAPFKQSGSPTAPLTVEIYSDYQCPSCAIAFRDTVPLLLTQYVMTGKVRLIHRDFPLPMHPSSKVAARFANAAGRVGLYDLVVGQLFRMQDQWGPNGNIEPELAKVLSPPVLRQIQAMLKDPKFDDTIDADLVMALADHIDRTPSMVFVTPGKRQVVAGIPSFPLLKGYLDDLLKQ